MGGAFFISRSIHSIAQHHSPTPISARFDLVQRDHHDYGGLFPLPYELALLQTATASLRRRTPTKYLSQRIATMLFWKSDM